MNRDQFPPGWDEKKVRDIIEYYDSQTEEETAAEIETVAEGYAAVEIPVELVPLVRSLVARYEQGVPLDTLQESLQPKSAVVETTNPG